MIYVLNLWDNIYDDKFFHDNISVFLTKILIHMHLLKTVYWNKDRKICVMLKPMAIGFILQMNLNKS